MEYATTDLSAVSARSVEGVTVMFGYLEPDFFIFIVLVMFASNLLFAEDVLIETINRPFYKMPGAGEYAS